VAEKYKRREKERERGEGERREEKEGEGRGREEREGKRRRGRKGEREKGKETSNAGAVSQNSALFFIKLSLVISSSDFHSGFHTLSPLDVPV